MARVPIVTLALVATSAASLTLVACSGGSDSSGGKSESPVTSSTPTGTTMTSPTQGPTESTPTARPSSAPPAQRTAGQLTKALLELKDLPSGFAVEPDSEDEGADVKVSSKDSRCARLVALMNAENPPGSKASALRSFSGGQDGPFIDEALDAMGTTQAVQALQRSFRSAIAACRTVTLTVPGEGSSPMQVRQVSAPKAGRDPVAVRFTATSGALEGFELTMVTAGVNDVVLAMSFIAAAPDDVDGATEAAAGKASQLLTGSKSGT